MKQLNFNIYIGKNMISEQADNVIAVITPKFFIPHGNCDKSGTLTTVNESNYFNRLDLAGTYIADWIEFVGDDKLIKATIYLNKLSLHKSFCGEEIIGCIDKLNNIENFSELKSFMDLI